MWRRESKSKRITKEKKTDFTETRQVQVRCSLAEDE